MKRLVPRQHSKEDLSIPLAIKVKVVQYLIFGQELISAHFFFAQHLQHQWSICPPCTAVSVEDNFRQQTNFCLALLFATFEYFIQDVFLTNCGLLCSYFWYRFFSNFQKSWQFLLVDLLALSIFVVLADVKRKLVDYSQKIKRICRFLLD